MDCSHYERCERRLHQPAAVLRNAKIPSKQRLCGRCAEANDDFWPQCGDFRIEPGPARRDLRAIWLLVNATLAAWFPFEVLDYVGGVMPLAADAGFFQGSIQQFPGGSDKRTALQIFLIAGLLAHKHDFRMFRALTEYGLGARLPKVAGFAVSRAGAELLNRFRLWEKGRSGSCAFRHLV